MKEWYLVFTVGRGKMSLAPEITRFMALAVRSELRVRN